MEDCSGNAPCLIPAVVTPELHDIRTAAIAFKIAMSLDFSMIIITNVETIEKAATTMIMVSKMNIITRSLLRAWKNAGKNSFQSLV